MNMSMNTSMNMNRALAFLMGCLGVRLIIALVAKNLNTTTLKYAAIPAGITGIAFISLYLFDLRKSGFEAGGKIWWNKLRPIHGVLYLLFACYAYKGEPFAWYVLLLDVIIGLIAWIFRYVKL